MRQTRVYLPTVIVVDDGSTDGTVKAAQSAGAQVLSSSDLPAEAGTPNPAHQGKGAALMAGWNRASQLGFHWALSLDGDGQHSAMDIPNFFKDLPHDRPALVIGNRMHNASAMPWLRRQVNRWMTARLARRLRVPLADSQCGFRLLHLGSLRQMGLVTRHFEIESELIVAAARLGIPVRFVRVQVIYRKGSSKINPVRDTIRWFRWFKSAG